MVRPIPLLVALTLGWGAAAVMRAQSAGAPMMPYAEARTVLDAIASSARPPELGLALPEQQLEAEWPRWVVRHDREVRARLDRGDEDSVVDMLLFGSVFTTAARLQERDVLRMVANGRIDDVVHGQAVRARLDDLVASLRVAGLTDRLELARQVLSRRDIDPGTESGRRQAREFFEHALTRMLLEYGEYVRRQADGDADRRAREQLTLFRDRGLASDTSIFPDFGVDQALGVMKAGHLFPRAIRQVAVVGPGLDYTDRRGGYDFYPQQTLQPFAVIDSLVRAGLASRDDIHLTTLDVSARVNDHLGAAVERARAGEPYTVQLPRDTTSPWTDELVAYWSRFGDALGETMGAVAPPALASQVVLRAVRIAPAVVRAVDPRDLNVVVQRLEPGAPEAAFDLVVATNVLIYYDAFEQCLAVANLAHMLRPGGWLVTNSAIFEVPATALRPGGFVDVSYTGLTNGRDRMFWYERR